MTIRRTIELALFAAAVLIATMAVHAWLTSRDDQQRLAATLAQQKQLLDAADSREHTRDSALNNTLAQIQQLKRTTLTPQQIVSALPKYLTLPQPVTLAPSGAVLNPSSLAGRDPGPGVGPTGLPQQGIGPSPNATTATRPAPIPSGPAHALPDAPTAQIPAADLKPLYDFIQDCRACQAELAAAKQNASDDAAKINALTAQRDAALTATKGGTFWHRLRRNAEWFALGAALGAAASKR